MISDKAGKVHYAKERMREAVLAVVQPIDHLLMVEIEAQDQTVVLDDSLEDAVEAEMYVQ